MDKPTITRSTGMHIGGGMFAGGGYEGATKELDDVILTAAEALQDAFNLPVTIRYNSDRGSGGAYLVTDDSRAPSDVGISASLVTQSWHNTRAEFPESYEGYDPLPSVGTILIDACVGPRVLVDASLATSDWGTAYKSVSSVAEGLAFCQKNADLKLLDAWLAEQARILAEKARLAEEYARSIRGSRRQRFARECWEYVVEHKPGEWWMPEAPSGIPYETARTIRTRMREIYRGGKLIGTIL